MPEWLPLDSGVRKAIRPDLQTLGKGHRAEGSTGAWLSIRISHSAWVIISSLVKYLRFLMNVVTKGRYTNYKLMSNPAM